MSNIQIKEKEVTEIQDGAKKFLAIKTVEQKAQAVEFIRGIKGMIKKVADAFDPIIQANHAAWKTSLGQKAKYNDPLETAEKAVKKAIGFFDLEEQQRIDRENAKARADAEALAAKEKAKLEKQADKHDAKGNGIIADDLRQQAQEVAPVVHTQTVQKVAGSGTRKNYKAVVTDKSKVPLEYLEVNISALNRVGNATAGQTVVPGIKWEVEAVVSVR